MGETKKDLDYYLSLPYTVELIPDEDGTWVARIPLLDGCITVGYNQVDALEMLEDAKRLWLEVSLESGTPIPEPQREPSP